MGTTLSPPTTTPKPTWTPGEVFSCDFEDESNAFCGWNNEPSKQHKWKVTKVCIIKMAKTTGSILIPIYDDAVFLLIILS